MSNQFSTFLIADIDTLKCVKYTMCWFMWPGEPQVKAAQSFSVSSNTHDSEIWSSCFCKLPKKRICPFKWAKSVFLLGGKCLWSSGSFLNQCASLQWATAGSPVALVLRTMGVVACQLLHDKEWREAGGDRLLGLGLSHVRGGGPGPLGSCYTLYQQPVKGKVCTLLSGSCCHDPSPLCLKGCRVEGF